MSRTFALVALGALVPVLALADEPPRAALVKSQMSFDEAMKPYADLKYDYAGYIAKDGKAKGKGLGCSAFTSVVLHRLRDGEKWLDGYDATTYQLYGEDAAKHFALKKAGKFESTALLDEAETKKLVKDGTLNAGELYLFNARREKNGHVGFVRVSEVGALTQWHYSSISNGLYTGDFRRWLKESMYRAATVELYLVPEKK